MADLSKNAILYLPENNADPLGAVQIIHGMGEYQGRYRTLAQFLSSNGYVVVTSDLRGHGNNIARISELGFFGDNAIGNLLGDIQENTLYLRNHFPGIPISIIAHGIGALIAVAYFKRYDNFINGLFLSGMPADRPSRIVGNLICRLLMTIKGEYFRSKIMDSLLVSSYIKQFNRERSTYAWLTSDPEVIANYDSDPKCGFIYTLNGDLTLIELMDAAYTKGSWIKKNPECTIRVLSGSDDACILNKTAFMKSVHLFTENGYKNVAFILYTNKRHDIFQDIGKEAVFNDVLKELENIRLNRTEAEKEEPVTHHVIPDDFIDPEIEQPFKDPEQKIDLEAFINAHNEKTPEDRNSKVEMVDFMNIESFIKTYGTSSEHPLNSRTEFSEYEASPSQTEDAESTKAAQTDMQDVTEGSAADDAETPNEAPAANTDSRTEAENDLPGDAVPSDADILEELLNDIIKK